MLAAADLVLTAEAAHRQHILDDFPQLHRQVFTLGQFAATDRRAPRPERARARRGRRTACVRRSTPEHDVADPYRRGKAAAGAGDRHNH